MTHEERKALNEFTMKELRSEPTPDLTQPLSEIGQEQWEGVSDSDPGAEVASERAEDANAELAMLRDYVGSSYLLSDFQNVQQMRDAIANLRAQLDAKEAECQQWKFKHETACQTITEMQLERQHRDSYTVLASISTFLGMGGGDVSAKIYEERIRQGIAHVTDVQNERAENAEEERDKLRAEVEELKNKLDDIGCALLGAEMPQVDQPGLLKLAQSVALERTRLTAELDADRKELGKTVETLINVSSELDAVRKERADLYQTANAYSGLMMNCADTLRSRGIDASVGPLDIRVIELAKRADAAQARCGALENLAIGILRTLDAGCEVLPSDMQRWWAAVNLTPSQQPDNLKGGDEPCGHESETGVAPAVLLSKSTADATKDTSVASNPQPESPIPSGVGHRPTVVCLCGSSKYPEEHMRIMMEETLAGRIVIPMGLYGHADFPPGAKAATNDGDESTEVKQMLDTLHHRKIDLADEILVVNVGGYIGSSTKREIAYAESIGKVVRFFTPPIAPEGKATEGEG